MGLLVIVHKTYILNIPSLYCWNGTITSLSQTCNLNIIFFHSWNGTLPACRRGALAGQAPYAGRAPSSHRGRRVRRRPEENHRFSSGLFSFDDGRGRYRNGVSAEASDEDGFFVRLLFVSGNHRAKTTVLPTVACVRTGRKRDHQTFGVCPQRAYVFHGTSLLCRSFLALSQSSRAFSRISG